MSVRLAFFAIICHVVYLAPYTYYHQKPAPCKTISTTTMESETSTSGAINGGWTPYGNWSLCSSTEECELGIWYRTRNCTNPEPFNGGDYCDGESKQYDTCGECTFNMSEDRGIPPLQMTTVLPYLNNNISKIDIYVSTNLWLKGVSGRYWIIRLYSAYLDSPRGDLTYFQTRNSALLSSLSTEVEMYFTVNFTGNWMFDIKIKIAYDADTPKLKNTVQAIIITDGKQTFLRSTYIKTFSPNVTVGFLVFNGFGTESLFEYPTSDTPDIVNISQESNVNQTGVFWYRVDSAIEGPN